MNGARHWRVVVAVWLMVLLPLQGLAAVACPHAAAAAAGVSAVAEPTPACHEASSAEETTLQAQADPSDCQHCLHCLLGHALAGSGPVSASLPAQAAAAPAEAQATPDAERRGLERPPRTAG